MNIYLILRLLGIARCLCLRHRRGLEWYGASLIGDPLFEKVLEIWYSLCGQHGKFVCNQREENLACHGRHMISTCPLYVVRVKLYTR